MSARRSNRPPLDVAHPTPAVVFTRASSSYARTAAGSAEEIAAQHAANRAVAARHGYTVDAEFSDYGSGLSLSRPGLDALLATIEAGAAAGARPTRLYVRDTARLGRFSDPRDLCALVERLAAHGVEVVVGDNATSSDSVASHVLAAI